LLDDKKIDMKAMFSEKGISLRAEKKKERARGTRHTRVASE
jgi:hypothetical protein